MPKDGVLKTFSSFRVAKDDLRRWRWDEGDVGAVTELAPDQVLVEIAKFAFTANNVTYARLGDQIAYWRFFPAAGGWGCIPVWGLGKVVRSRHPEVPEGERVYGYFPMATHLVLQPGALRGARFVDESEHRRELPRTYNEYVLIDRDAGYDRLHEDAHLVLRPLFSLSFFCAEHLKEERFFGARRVLISSASSKTALGLAFLLAREHSPDVAIHSPEERAALRLLAGGRSRDVEILGLTSSKNLDFVARRGVYDRVLAYEGVSSLTDAPTVFVDIAGDARVRAAVHHALRDSLRHSLRAGFTHGDALGSVEADLPGPAPQLFFTPDHILRRRKEWGAETLRARLAEAWHGFLDYVAPWLVIERAIGRRGVEQVYREVLDGKTPPEKAHLLSIAAP